MSQQTLMHPNCALSLSGIVLSKLGSAISEQVARASAYSDDTGKVLSFHGIGGSAAFEVGAAIPKRQLAVRG
jgi:hypothetical protein